METTETLIANSFFIRRRNNPYVTSFLIVEESDFDNSIYYRAMLVNESKPSNPIFMPVRWSLTGIFGDRFNSFEEALQSCKLIEMQANTSEKVPYIAVGLSENRACYKISIAS